MKDTPRTLAELEWHHMETCKTCQILRYYAFGSIVVFLTIIVVSCARLRPTTTSEIPLESTEIAQISTIVSETREWIPLTDKDQERLVDAIYWAEGGQDARKPFGILSVPCEGYKECRRICKNTVRNNIGRYKRFGHKTFDTYLQFLQSRYAPVQAHPLNKNWGKNVRWFLNNPKEVRI